MLTQIILIAAFSCSIAGCSLTYRGTRSSDPRYDPHREAPQINARGLDYLDPATMPDSGFYFTYQFSQDHKSIANVESMLSDLYSRGFDILIAWYRQETNGCNPPGSTFTTTTIYRPQFFILVGKSDPGLARFRFREIATVPKFCPYSITEYTIQPN